MRIDELFNLSVHRRLSSACRCLVLIESFDGLNCDDHFLPDSQTPIYLLVAATMRLLIDTRETQS